MKKIVFFTKSTAPYRTLQLREWANTLDIKITLCYYEKETRKWNIEPIGNNVEEIFLDMIPPFDGRIHWKIQLHKGLKKLVKENDVIMSGSYYTLSDNIIIKYYCKRFRKPFILLMDGFDTYRIGKKENFIKFWQKKNLLRDISYIFGNGKVTKDYYVKTFGFPEEKIINQCLTVDVETIQSFAEDKEKINSTLRNSYGISDSDKVIMFSGRIIDIKCVDFVIRAIGRMQCKEQYIFLMAGDGELRQNCETLAESLNVRCVCTGFIKKQEALFKLYYMANCLILPSLYEPWGLVINEAMASGLPIISSDHCGAYMDLVQDGENGYILHGYDESELADRIRKCCENEERFGKKSLEIISNWTFKESANNFKMLLSKLDGEE